MLKTVRYDERTSMMHVRYWLLSLVFSIAFSVCLYAEPIGSGFTYQGSLQDNGLPVEGTVDLEFRLFDQPDAGTDQQVGPTVGAEDIPVADGTFTVSLDFGNVFMEDRGLWLEIGVREGASEEPHSILTPRQRLTATPLALVADDARRLGGKGPADFLEISGGTLTGNLVLEDGALELVEGTHQGGQIFADSGGVTLSTSPSERFLVQGGLVVSESVGVGIDAPLETLHLDGALALGNTDSSTIGSIRWNGTDFEGFDGSAWLSLTEGPLGDFVDLNSNQTIGGQKTFVERTIMEDGLTALDTVTIGSPQDGEELGIYTSGTGLTLFRVGGQRFGELRTNTSDDFILQANSGRLRTQGDLYLQFSASSSFRDLYAGEVKVHDSLKFLDDDGVTRGQFLLSGNDVSFFDGSGDGHFVVRDRVHVTGDSTDQYLTLGTSNSTSIAFEEGDNSSRDLQMRMGSDGSGRFTIRGYTAVDLDLDVGGNIDVTDDLEVGRNLIIGSIPTGASAGQVCFDSTVFGDIIIRCSSSARYKEQILPFSGGLDVIEKLRPVTFQWRKDSSLDLGFVAEEVAAVEPRLATYVNHEVDGVKYDRLTAVLVNAVKEQQQMIQELRALVCKDHSDASVCVGKVSKPGPEEALSYLASRP